MTLISPVAAALATRGVAFAPQIAAAAVRHGLDPALLAAVAAQETGGPDSDAGSNVVGDGGHGHGVFQIDDRFHPFAATAAAMDPSANADYAANMLRGLLDRYGGNVHDALSAYNAGSPYARGTSTRWRDGSVLGYADSVLRHYQRITGEAPAPPAPAPSCAQSDTGSLLAEAFADQPLTSGSVNALSDYHRRSFRDLAGSQHTNSGDALAQLVAGDDTP